MGKLALKKFILISITILILIPVIPLSIGDIDQSLNPQNDLVNMKIAITPEIDLSQLPDIDYSELNAAWNDQKIEMLIVINDSSYLAAVSPLMEWKNEKGVRTIVLSNYSDYQGRDKAEKIRNMIKDFYEKEDIKWVLLAGDAEEDLIPIREVYNPDVILVSDESEYSNWDDYYKPTDFYYADLSGSWDDNNNNIWGESLEYNGDVDEISWIPEVYVGRLPASNPSELSVMINKTLKYETNPNNGTWMNSMLLAGGVSSYYQYDPDPAKVISDEDEARLMEYIWENYVIDEMNFTHLAKTTSSFTPKVPLPPNSLGSLNSISFRTEFDSGYSTVIIAGHSDPTVITDASNEIYYNNIDALSSGNVDKPSLFYADACTTSSYDKGDTSIGERLITRANSGAIGYIGGLRVNWYFQYDENLEKLNRANAKLFWKEFFAEKKFQQGRALYDSKVEYMNSDYFVRGEASMTHGLYHQMHRKNVLTYNLLGDPELDVYTKVPSEVPDYFTGTIYEGQCISFQVKDNLGRIVPRARINLKTLSGKYRTVYADIDGFVDFRLPAEANENYSVIITGHNVIPSYFNFTTLPDTDIPELLTVKQVPLNPTATDNILFSFNASDTHSGIESVFLLISNNNFSDFSLNRVQNDFNENKQEFSITLNKLEPGEYSYLVITRDYKNKTSIYYNNHMVFSIPKPITDYVLIIVSIMMIALVGISIAVVIDGVKRHNKNVRNLI
ncbi:MAG: C25 family cysteine peptidase [Promethearchaeota archaeon]